MSRVDGNGSNVVQICFLDFRVFEISVEGWLRGSVEVGGWVRFVWGQRKVQERVASVRHNRYDIDVRRDGVRKSRKGNEMK